MAWFDNDINYYEVDGEEATTPEEVIDIIGVVEDDEENDIYDLEPDDSIIINGMEVIAIGKEFKTYRVEGSFVTNYVATITVPSSVDENDVRYSIEDYIRAENYANDTVGLEVVDSALDDGDVTIEDISVDGFDYTSVDSVEEI